MASHSDRIAAAKSTHTGVWLRAFAGLGLALDAEPLQRLMSQSMPARALFQLRRSLWGRLAPFTATSWVAKVAPTLSLASVCLLVLLSPYLGTGKNAFLVLFAFGSMLLQVVSSPPCEEVDALDLPFLGMLFVSVLAVGFSPNLVLSVKGFAKMLIFWMSFFSFRHALGRGDRSWTALFGALFVGALAQSLYGIYQWKIHVAPLALWEDADSEIQLTRVYGTLKNPNLLGGYLIPVIPFAVAAALTWRQAILRGLALATAVSACACLYFTYSRGAYLGLAVEALVALGFALALLGPEIRRRPWLMALIAVLFVGALGVAGLVFEHSPGMQQRILSIGSARGDSSNSFRLNVWHAVKHMIRDSWWAGIGLGNDAFRKVYALYMVSGFEALGAYNIFLEEAAEKGIFGLLAFLWLLVSMIGRALYHFASGKERAWSAAAVAAIGGLVMHGMFDTVFYRPSIQILFWLTLAVILNVPVRQRSGA